MQFAVCVLEREVQGRFRDRLTCGEKEREKESWEKRASSYIIALIYLKLLPTGSTGEVRGIYLFGPLGAMYPVADKFAACQELLNGLGVPVKCLDRWGEGNHKMAI